MITAKQAHLIAEGEVDVKSSSLLTSLFKLIDIRCRQKKFNLTHENTEKLEYKDRKVLEELGFRVSQTENENMNIITIFW